MKKNILILVGILGIFASNIAKAEAINSRNFEINFNYNDAVNFFERGVEFFVFANGDFDFDNLLDHVSFISKAPGGVGPMTITSLLQNTLECFERLMRNDR